MIKYEDYENETLIADGAFWEGIVMPGDPFNDFIPHDGDEVVDTNSAHSWTRPVDDEIELNTWSVIPILNEIEYQDDYTHS